MIPNDTLFLRGEINEGIEVAGVKKRWSLSVLVL